jgi:hypothetical protein
MSMPMALTLPLAHLLPTGLGPWGDGMARLFLEPTELLLAFPCTALVSVVGLLVALEVRLRPVVLLSLAAVLSGLFALVAGSALAGHPGALAALLAETVAMAVVSTLLCQSLAPPHPPLAGHRPAGGRQLDHGRRPADAGLAGPPSPVVPMRPSRHTMEATVPVGHSLEATRKVRWGAGSSCAESGTVPQL